MEAKKKKFLPFEDLIIPAVKMADATCKAIWDMHQRHHGNEKGGWIRNQLKRIYEKNNPHKS